MRIGTLKENKPNESRVILTPIEVEELIGMGHEVFVQKDAGKMAGFENDEYSKAGAVICDTFEEIYEKCDMVTKVKEIFPEEYDCLREGQIIFACIHPAANKEEVQALLDAKVIGFTAEDTHRFGSPNCEAAGKIGALMGAYHLFSTSGGRGQTIFGIGGAPSANVMVLGAGIVGRGATDVLSSLGGNVYLMDINVGVLREAQYNFPKNVTTVISNRANIRKLLPTVDLVINCVKWPKHREDHLIAKEDLTLLKKGSVIVDVSADLDGAIETYRPTTHADPIYSVDGIIHYGVDNIPGVAPHTVSKAYAASVFDHIKNIAQLGVKEACRRDGYLRRSMCVNNGENTHIETAAIQKREFVKPEDILDYSSKEILDIAPNATTTTL